VTWTLKGMHEDLHAEEADDRWLLTYEVPAEFAHDGTYSVSFPKDMVNHMAVTYGYDVDDPVDIEDLFDHLFHMAYMTEVARREGRVHEATWNPYELKPESARQVIKDQVTELKRTRPIRHGGKADLTNPLTAKVTVVDDPIDIVKRDMLSRVDRKVIADRTEAVAQIRVAAQDRMISHALRINARIDSGGMT
jgi:hypothetical protein